MSASDHLSEWQFATGKMRLRDMSPTASVPFDASDFDILKSHIRENGVQSPISIKHDRPNYRPGDSRPRRGQNYIEQGHHRRRALTQLGRDDAPVNVRYRDQMPADLIDPRPISRDEYVENLRQPSWTERR